MVETYVVVIRSMAAPGEIEAALAPLGELPIGLRTLPVARAVRVVSALSLPAFPVPAP